MKGKYQRSLALLGITVVVGGLLGYFSRYVVTNDSERKKAHYSNDVEFQKAKSSKRDSSELNRWRNDLRNLEGSRHWLHLLGDIEGVNLDDLAELITLVEPDGVAFELIVQYWVEQDPQHLFDTIVERIHMSEADQRGFPHADLREALFKWWPKVDLEAAIEALSGSKPFPGQQNYQWRVFADMVRLDPMRALELNNRWGGINGGLSDWVKKDLKKWAKTQPKVAAEAIFEAQPSSSVKSYVEALAEAWAETHPDQALDYASSKKSRYSRLMQETVIKKWAREDFASASNWLEEQGDSTLRSRLTPQLIAVWGEESPQEALSWCQNHLKGPLLSSSVTRLVAGVAARDLEAAVGIVTNLEPSQSRTLAGVEVAGVWFTSNSSQNGIDPAAIEWLRDIDDPQMQGAILGKVGSHWRDKDLEGLKSFLSSEPAVNVPNYLFDRIADDLTRRDPEAAFQWAASLPEEQAKRVAGSTFRSWLKYQPKLAESWFKALPVEDSRRMHLVEGLVGQSLWVPEKVLMQRLSLLQEKDFPAVQEVLENSQISESRKQKILGAISH